MISVDARGAADLLRQADDGLLLVDMEHDRVVGTYGDGQAWVTGMARDAIYGTTLCCHESEEPYEVILDGSFQDGSFFDVTDERSVSAALGSGDGWMSDPDAYDVEREYVRLEAAHLADTIAEVAPEALDEAYARLGRERAGEAADRAADKVGDPYDGFTRWDVVGKEPATQAQGGGTGLTYPDPHVQPVTLGSGGPSASGVVGTAEALSLVAKACFEGGAVTLVSLDGTHVVTGGPEGAGSADYEGVGDLLARALTGQEVVRPSLRGDVIDLAADPDESWLASPSVGDVMAIALEGCPDGKSFVGLDHMEDGTLSVTLDIVDPADGEVRTWVKGTCPDNGADEAVVARNLGMGAAARTQAQDVGGRRELGTRGRGRAR